ncbi:hypothetical protein E8K88_07125 [Lampropedia aestuarii]|uniref:Outer membrane protein beta-barrel domain-containing protein n=1 Tax=Lampropedia aestuarii TaxID=2562762 RepID=A0A4S5BTH4_9BURK|nr:hypothetical protein [Lampropedia aestuarii]THJ34285.1 hypothetical protein E8K88_07125 [Lampropedia aestuarii]
MAEHAISWRLASGLALAVVCGLASPAWAQKPTQADAQDNAWRLQLTPYVWMAGLNGDIKPLRSGPTGHVNRSFSDILSELDTAFFLTGTARKGQAVLHGDISHALTSDRSDLPLGLRAKASVKQTSAALLAGYNWLESGRSNLDTMAGLRFWDVKAKLAIDGVGDVQSSASFIDPVLAGRWRSQLASRWSSIVYADIGGFGVGSRLTWQGMAALNYQWSDGLFFSLGYRYLQVDYRRNGKRLDFNQSGPLLGATFRF